MSIVNGTRGKVIFLFFYFSKFIALLPSFSLAVESSDVFRAPVYFSGAILQSQFLIGRAKFPARTISKISPLRKQGQMFVGDRAYFFFISSVRSICAQ